MFRWLLFVGAFCCALLLNSCSDLSSAKTTATPQALQSTASPPNHVVVSLLIAPTPLATVPTSTTTPGSGTVTGTVLLEDGRCCVGGRAGTTVQVDAAFNATSTDANVIEMRVRAGGGGCAKEGALDQIAWEPFAATKTFTYAGIPINWSGYYVSAQFRDDKRRVSAIACDDISVEGMP